MAKIGGRKGGAGRRHHGAGRRHHGIGHRHHGIGHRHHGIGHRHRSHFSMFHHRRRRGLYHSSGRGGVSISYEQYIHIMATSTPNATIANGTYTHIADQARIVSQLDEMVAQAATMNQNGIPIHTVDITVVGNTAETGNSACYCLTCLFVCLIFPIFFMCCDWWKRIVYPKYEVNPETY